MFVCSCVFVGGVDQDSMQIRSGEVGGGWDWFKTISWIVGPFWHCFWSKTIEKTMKIIDCPCLSLDFSGFSRITRGSRANESIHWAIHCEPNRQRRRRAIHANLTLRTDANRKRNELLWTGNHMTHENWKRIKNCFLLLLKKKIILLNSVCKCYDFFNLLLYYYYIIDHHFQNFYKNIGKQ